MNGIPPKEESRARIFRKASATEFHAALSSARLVDKGVEVNCDLRPSYDGGECYLAAGGLAGFCVISRELTGLFNVSAHRGLGEVGLRLAVGIGADHLDCFEGKLSEMYRKFGFYEVKREKNWYEGGPDVIFMERRAPAQTVLHLFPGGGMTTIGAQQTGKFSVVRGPDVLHGWDVRGWAGMRGKFDGVIGGPPCQSHSNASELNGTDKIDCIPDFVRIVEALDPKWAVMECVVGAQPAAPAWPFADISDVHVGGLTKRVRRFWLRGIPPPPGSATSHDSDYSDAAPTVIATSHKNRGPAGAAKGFHQMDMYQAAVLQGREEWLTVFLQNAPKGLSDTALNVLAVHMLGNGPTRAMDKYIFDYIANYYCI